MTVRMAIDPKALVWARENHCMDRDSLAAAVGVSLDTVAGWEAGTIQPSYTQMRRVAEHLDQGLPFFFVAPPADKELPQVVDSRGWGGPSPALAREMIRAERYRQAILSYGGAPPRRLELGRLTADTIERLAADVCAVLVEHAGEPAQHSNPQRDCENWRRLLGEAGVLVFQTSLIPPAEFSSMSVCHEDYPIILINALGSDRDKTFSLFHALGHLINKTSALCLAAVDHPDEVLADAFAAAVLLPADEMRAAGNTRAEGVSLVELVAEQLEVSCLAAAIRLGELGLVGSDTVTDVRRLVEAERLERFESVGRGGRPQWWLRYRDLGEVLIGVIARALEAEAIDWVEATTLTNTKGALLQKILDEYRGV